MLFAGPLRSMLRGEILLLVRTGQGRDAAGIVRVEARFPRLIPGVKTRGNRALGRAKRSAVFDTPGSNRKRFALRSYRSGQSCVEACYNDTIPAAADIESRLTSCISFADAGTARR